MVFWCKNLDLDSNLYNLENASKKLVKYYETDPTPEPYRCAGLKLANKYYEIAIFFGRIVF
jgi:hypothetical protein